MEAEQKVPNGWVQGPNVKRQEVLKLLKGLFYKSFQAWENDKTIRKHGIIFFNRTMNSLLHKYRTQYANGSLVALL